MAYKPVRLLETDSLFNQYEKKISMKYIVRNKEKVMGLGCQCDRKDHSP
jgi:hypothetical protein